MFMDLFYNPFQNIERCIKAETDPNKIDFLKGRQTSIYKDYKKHLQIEFHRAQLKYEMTNNQGDGFSTRAIAFEQDKISVGVFYRDLANKMLNHKKHISLLFLFEMSLLTKRLHPDAYIGSAPISGTSTESEKIIQNFQQKIWKNGFDSVTLEQLDNIINDIQNGRLEYFNTGRNGENGSRTRSERLAIGAVVLCRAGKRVGCKALEYIASERSWRYKELIEQWARLKGFWFDENIYDILNRKGFKYLDPILHGRREAEVFTDGKIVVKIVSCKLYPCNIAAAIDRFIIHNQIFGERTALNIIGFGMIDNDFKIIAEQAYIHGYSADEEDTEKYLRSLFDKVTKDDSISYHTTDFIIGDLHQGNVLKSYDTGKVYVIDNFLKFNNNEFVDVSSLSGIDNPNAVKTDFDEVYAAICDFYGKGYSGTRVYPHTYYFDIKGKWNQFFKLIKTTPSYYILRSIRRFGGDFYYRNNDYGIAVDSATWENCFKHITAYPSPLFDNEILLLKQKYKTTKNR